MRRAAIFGLAATWVLGGCSSGSSGSSGETADATADVRSDVTTPDATAEEGGKDSGGEEASPGTDGGGDADAASSDADAASSDADAASSDAVADADADASNGCPSSWLIPPPFDPGLQVPDGGAVLLHAAGMGAQVYACVANADGGSSTWTLLGPDAVLNDCTGTLIGHHFPSEAGSAYPEWQTTDGTFVIGHKLASFTPDGGAESVPWLLLQAVDAGGTGTLRQVTYIQRLDTDGGLAAGDCDAGDMVRVPYTADYFFYGP